jgi:two-component system cell cycle sensor histidine kinase/response regulator CckA
VIGAEADERWYFERVLEDLPVVAYVFDLTTRRNVYVNRRWTEDFGFDLEATRSPDDFLAEQIHAEDLPAVAEHHRALRACSDGRVHVVEYRMRTPAGGWVWLESRDRVFSRDDAGRAVQIIGIAQDVTARRVADAERRESDARLRAIVEHHPDAVFVAGADGGLVEANAAACEHLGRTRGELLGARIAEFVAPEYHDRVRERLRSGGPHGYVESAHVRRDGVRVPVEIAVIPVEIGGQPAMLGVARDISERKAAEESLRQEAELRRAIIDNTVAGLCVCEDIAEEPGIRFTVWNQRMEEITGYTMAEINQLGWYQSVYPDPETQRRAVARMDQMRTGNNLEAEPWEICRKDGERRTLAISTRMLLDPEGKPRVLGVMNDVTERLRLTERLQEAQRLEAIGRLAGAVAHDFNNVLAGILGAASLLADDASLSPEDHALAQEISLAAERGGALTQQLLTFSRRQRTELRTFDWSTQVRDVLRVVRRLLGSLVRVEAEILPGCHVHADASMLDQIVINLAVNARDAMPNGGTLHLWLGPEPPGADEDTPSGSGFVLLRVSDEGAGIPPEILPHIFEPFYTTKSKGQGTGLGLATVYGIVTQHGGTVEVQSRSGQGSEFAVRLPRVARVEVVRGLEVAPVTGAPDCVLLVEDDSVVRNVTARLLARRGTRVIPAASASEALERFATEGDAVSIVLSDIALGGGMTGAELAVELLRRRPGLPIVLMSGYDESLGAIPAGCRFLQKPFREGELLQALAAFGTA